MRNFGGIIKNSLITIFDQNDTDEKGENLTPSFQHSSFIESENLSKFMKINKNKFSLFSLNVDSINQKYTHISSYLDVLATSNVVFSAIAIQEARICDDTDCKAYDIPGYTLEPQGKICSEKGGLLTYIHKDYNFTKRQNLYKRSSIYEAMYLSITGPRLKKAITLGNIYRPPRLNNNLGTIRQFIKEIGPTISKLKK